MTEASSSLPDSPPAESGDAWGAASERPTEALAKRRILFIGGGNMASAMISGLVRADLPAAQIAVVEPVAAARQALQDRIGVQAYADAEAIDGDLCFDAIVLAVKPQQAAGALKNCRPLLARQPQAVLVSIAAGLAIDLLVAMSGGHRRVIRAMPNTPSLIGAGISGLYAPPSVADEDLRIARAILASTGAVVVVDHEHLIDTVTAVSGSGPAYAFYLMEAMIEAGKAGGLDPATARVLALQTVKGAALLALASEEPPETLRARVTSPAGTTAAAVAVLDERAVKASLVEAVRAAAARSRQLADEAKAAQAT
jgi:pyrroline-5-carboxylate reductase